MLDKYEGKPLRREYIEINQEKLKTVELLDLSETVDELIDVYSISDEWYPKFSCESRGILYYSKMVCKELIKRGFSHLLGEPYEDNLE